MPPSFFCRSLLLAAALLSSAACSQVQPAGSVGYILEGDTHLRPTPTNYRHVPPREQDRAPTPMQWGLSF